MSYCRSFLEQRAGVYVHPQTLAYLQSSTSPFQKRGMVFQHPSWVWAGGTRRLRTKSMLSIDIGCTLHVQHLRCIVYGGITDEHRSVILHGMVAVSCLVHGWLYLFVPPCAPEMMACGNDSGFRLSHLLSRSIPAPSTTHVHVARVHAPSCHGGVLLQARGQYTASLIATEGGW